MSLKCLSALDHVFRPQVQGCRDSFDLKLPLEQCVLAVVPSSLLLLVSFWKYFTFQTADTKLSLSASQIRASRIKKEVTITGYASSQLILLIIWSISSKIRTNASIASAVLCFIADLAIFCSWSQNIPILSGHQMWYFFTSSWVFSWVSRNAEPYGYWMKWSLPAYLRLVWFYKQPCLGKNHKGNADSLSCRTEHIHLKF